MLKNNNFINENDLVLLYENYNTINPIYIKKNEIYNNKYGTFLHNDMLNKKYGSIVYLKIIFFNLNLNRLKVKIKIKMVGYIY